MKSALIITGGFINYSLIEIDISDYDFVIAADSGYVAAKKMGITPDIIVGDFDSAMHPVSDAEIIVFPPEKDDTDTMLACKTAIERGATLITVVGGTGGRADHFLSNVFSIEHFLDDGINMILTDGENKIRAAKDTTLTIPQNNGYFSLFPLDECIVTLTGCKYPLENYLLTLQNPSFAVSNEVISECATLNVQGKVLICECKNV